MVSVFSYNSPMGEKIGALSEPDFQRVRALLSAWHPAMKELFLHSSQPFEEEKE